MRFLVVVKHKVYVQYDNVLMILGLHIFSLERRERFESLAVYIRNDGVHDRRNQPALLAGT